MKIWMKQNESCEFRCVDQLGKWENKRCQFLSEETRALCSDP